MTKDKIDRAKLLEKKLESYEREKKELESFQWESPLVLDKSPKPISDFIHVNIFKTGGLLYVPWNLANKIKELLLSHLELQYEELVKEWEEL